MLALPVGFVSSFLSFCDSGGFGTAPANSNASDVANAFGFLFRFSEKMPCLSAFWDERNFPSAVIGPVDFCALAWLAAICFGVVMVLPFSLLNSFSE